MIKEQLKSVLECGEDLAELVQLGIVNVNVVTFTETYSLYTSFLEDGLSKKEAREKVKKINKISERQFYRAIKFVKR